MEFTTDFCKLKLQLDNHELQNILSHFQSQDWIKHGIETTGNASVMLISAGGTYNTDYALSAPAEPTPYLDNCLYIQQILTFLNTPVSRCRLVKLPAKTTAPTKIPAHYHWFRHTAVYIPIQTQTGVDFHSGTSHIFMQTGEAWIANPKQAQGLANNSEQDSIFLVIDVKHSDALNNLIAKALDENQAVEKIQQDFQADIHLNLPRFRFEVFTPAEIKSLTEQLSKIVQESEITTQGFSTYQSTLSSFKKEWQFSFEQFGNEHAGEAAYYDAILSFKENVLPKIRRWVAKDPQAQAIIETITSLLQVMVRPAPSKVGQKFLSRQKVLPNIDWQSLFQATEQFESQASYKCLSQDALRELLPHFRVAESLDKLYPHLADQWPNKEELTAAIQQLLSVGLLQERFANPKFDRPIFIVSAPRAGSTLLYETLAKFPEIWAIGQESHEIIEGIKALHPDTHHYTSNRLTAEHASVDVEIQLQQRFARQLHDSQGKLLLDYPVAKRPMSLRFLEKTPKNALRVSFLKKVFPEALFIFLYRDPQENVSSMLEGWRSRSFIAYKQLPKWPHKNWCFLLPPEWQQNLQNKPLVEIAGEQWRAANYYIWEDLKTLPREDWYFVHYHDLIKDTQKVMRDISDFAGLIWHSEIEQSLSKGLSVSKMALSAPCPDKWRKHTYELDMVLPKLETFARSVELELCQK
ncbi:sulfotransferase [Candidatus Albibeggiatoa sp. nov. NOAA]|uniref:sulfotransferase family protein n=1 Tax=Candidatus Albibeggiatoa sp. nov. NOAA TaxID=3162724 RepID=UPI0032F31BD5|nr:sulfotransferase [Thiotrichaceae bacterium]